MSGFETERLSDNSVNASGDNVPLNNNDVSMNAEIGVEDDTGDLEEDLTLTEFVHEEIVRLINDPRAAERWKSPLRQIDAVCILGEDSCGHLPTLHWNTSFRKSYTILFWIRPILVTATHKSELNVESIDSHEDQESNSQSKPIRRIWYRFSSSPDDHAGVGICVQSSEWILQSDGTIHTTLTAFGLPPKTQLVQCPLYLIPNEWSLIAFSHTFPYLKRPQWTVSVNGNIMARAELQYPVVDQPLQHSTVLENLCVGGVRPFHDPNSDDAKPASILTEKNHLPSYSLHFQLATIALHCESISTEIISLLYCGGPALSLQQYGRIVTPLPPIDNWTKGSSLNGPNIGIPLAVHPVALEVQHLVDSVVHFFAATNSKVLRGRILFQQAYLPGESRETPKVGLLQPSVVHRDEDLPVLNLVGNVHLIHALSDFLLQSNNSRVNPNLVETSKNLSIVLLEQGLLPALVLPLFLALLPSGQHTDLQKPLVEQSNRFLFNLYSKKGEWAARLIQLFADVVYYGGARVHEQVLQHGLIHVIASCLRLGLLRAQHLHVQNFDSIDKFMTSRPAEEAVLKSMHDSVCPASVPQKIAQACSNLVAVCCGITIEIDFTPSTRLQRSSDMALTAVFGLALNLDLWGKSESALLTILTEVCWRYGNVQGGQMLRRQVPIQSLLDCLRSRLEFASHPEISARLGDIVQHMLLASLSHRRNISIGEHDIAACMSALSDCPLGSVGTHVILSSLKNILEFCHSDDEQLVEIATRMGRNLIINQYHDVIAPMLLSRTVFCGERTMSSPETKMIDSRWQNHWRMALTLFVWVTSISGPEGISSSQSTGGLLLASGLAGSLKNCLVDEHDAQSLWLKQIFLPHPTMALMIGSQGNADSWSYSDLLSERLQVMMPLLPGLVMSLVCDEDISNQSLQILSDLFASISASLHRVLGVAFDTLRPNKYVNKLSPGKDLGNLVDAATDYLPQLTLVSLLLEHHIRKQEGWTEGEPPVVLQPVKHQASNPHGSEGEWVDVPPSPFSEDNTDFVLDAHLTKQQRLCFDEKLKSLQWSQKSALSLVTDLIGNVMNVDEGEMSTNVWRSVIATLDDASSYIRDRSSNDVEHLSRDILCRLVAIVLTKAQSFRMYDWEMWSSQLCRAIARMCNMVEEKNLLATSNDEPLSRDQIVLQVAILDLLLYGREMTGWCQLIFPTPPEPLTNNPDFGEDEISFNQTQATEYVKSSEKGNFNDNRKMQRNFVPPEIPGASSKLMLPILQPAFRVTMATLEILKSHQQILIPESGAPDSMVTKSLILHVGEEVRLTLVAGIVGLSFANAREMALHGMTTLRRLLGGENLSEFETRKYFASFLCDMVEEIRARYEGERRRREKALFDAYDDADTANREAAASQEVERIILGGALIPGEGTARVDESEEITFGFQNPPFLGNGNEDFVMFHENYTDGETSAMENILAKAGGGAQLGWDQFKGFGTTLEECSVLSKSGRENDPSGDVNAEAAMFLKILGPYLDTWDARTLEEDEDQRMFRLYDQSAFEKDNNDEFLQNENNISHPRSEAAADAMSTYIEIASSEKARLSDFVNTFLPSLRFSCQAYTERYCWSRYFETLNNNDACGMSEMWERGISDGNRDIRSRLVTMPCHPQFKRYIPKYLDHAIDPEQVDDVSISAPSLEPERSPIGEILAPSNVMSSTDLLSDTLRTLVQTGNLEIVDVTKKSVDEEEHLKLSAIPLGTEGEIDDLEDDIYGDGSLGFPSRDEDNNNIHENASSDAATANDTEESESGITATRVSEKGQGTGHYYVASSIYGHPPDNSTSVSSLRHSFGPEMIEKQFDNCLHVRAEGSRKCYVLLSQTHVILEYDSESAGLYEGELMAVREEVERQKLIKECGGSSQQVDRDGQLRETIQDELERRLKETASLRPKSIRWNLSELSHVYLRRCRLRDSALEMFFIPSGGSSFGGFGLYSPSTSLFLDFGSGHDGNRRRDDAASSIMKRAPPQTIKQWPDRSGQFLHEQLSRLTMGWVDGRITNFDYLLHLNMLAGRSYNDLTQYPVMPWVLSNYVSEEIPDLTDPNNFRDLTKPVGALNPDRLRDFLERYETFADPTIPAFMYGSHYSTSAGVVYHFLVRMHPFAGLHRQLQGGYFDVADRLFSSVPRTWDMCTGYSAAEVKELTPEWYCNPAFLKNTNNFKLGTSQDGELLGDVVLPPWAKNSPEIFVEVMRNALESDICSEMLPDWIDLIFGRKQQGPEAIKAHNVFFYLTYYGSVDVASIEDEGLREATELQIAHFGQCPMQLFVRPHVRRVQKTVNFRKLSFYQLLSANAHGAKHPSDGIHRPYTTKLDGSMRLFGEPLYLPFFTAPQSHWVHLDAPPPGPHANLIAVRLAGVDRCVAIDSAGIYHSFRWAWKPDETVDQQNSEPGPIDRGNFIAQRELPRFRTVPRLIYSQSTTEDRAPAVAISKTLFASRSVLLVLSDGDGCGGLAMQLIDPSKGTVKAEAMVPSAHSSRVTCIAMDPIGTAAGHGGVGGELAIVGSADGGTTLWRFMSSHYLPLRPRIRMRGHCGSRVQAVALSSAIHICASISREKCCIFSIGNGAMIHSWPPPDVVLPMITEGTRRKTIFCDTPALGLSVQGFVVTVCKTFIESDDGMSSRNVITLHLFSLEGVSLGSKALESWRGIPHKIACTPDGTAITVCHGRGVTIHRLSAITPLEYIDEWHTTESDELDETTPAAWDVDFGPSLMRPIVAAAACSSGVLRLHALPGISAWSERHRKSSIGIGMSFSKPVGRLRDVVGKFVGVGKDVGKEVSSEVRERGVGGFLTGTLFRKNAK